MKKIKKISNKMTTRHTNLLFGDFIIYFFLFFSMENIYNNNNT